MGDNLFIVVEDLGVIILEVEVLWDEFNFFGMKVFYFVFDFDWGNFFLFFNYSNGNVVVYIGIYDNDIIVGWF